MMSRLVTLLVGFYAGAYACQNYEMPHLPGPIGLWEKLQETLKDFEKKKKD